MVERRDQLRLRDKAVPEVGIARELGQERLQRRFAVQDRVLGLVDRAHPAAAERARDPVAGDRRPGSERLTQPGCYSLSIFVVKAKKTSLVIAKVCGAQ